MTTATTTVAHAINQLPELISALKNDLADSHAILVCDVKSHMEEFAYKIPKTTETDIHTSLADELQSIPRITKHYMSPTPSWRILGTKKVWKRDWTEYDARQRSRHLQEKNAENARRRHKQRKRHHQEIFNKNKIKGNKNYNIDTAVINTERAKISNSGITTTTHMNSTRAHATLPLDKDLLAAARVQFSRPPKTDNGPIFINFQKGETINPYRTEKPAEPEHPPLLDPMRPPIVRLTEQSAAGDRRFLKARLRDPKIMDIVRTYLSYLHDQPPSVCIRGITKTSATLMLAAEGLPTDTALLREIFLDVHEELGIPRTDALADLNSHRAFLLSERTQRLQQTREAARKFYSPPNFQRH